jgi:predicted RNA-binding protein Jag
VVTGGARSAPVAGSATMTKPIQDKAMVEVQNGIDTVLQSGKPFELAPQPASVRKVQFQMIEARRLASEAIGEDPNRRVRILPTKLAV